MKPTDASGLSIQVSGVTKRFGDVVAIANVSITVNPGVVLAIVGENGAGKSTLVNVISGGLHADSGGLSVNGRPVRFHGRHEASRLGIGLVSQHLTLVNAFTVAENVVLGREPSGPLFDPAQAESMVSDLGQRYGLTVDPSARVQDLPIGLKQRVEILKLLFQGARCLIFDEPTAVLSPVETQPLFEVMRELAAEGRTIVFITHKLMEVQSVADKVAVLRRGRLVLEADSKDTNVTAISTAMFPDSAMLPAVLITPPVTSGVTALRAKNFRLEGFRSSNNFEVGAGEIIGIAGVEGNGQSQLAEVLTGMMPVSQGRIEIWNGHRYLNVGPGRRVPRSMVGHVPEDRSVQGIIADQSICENMLLGSTSSQFSRWGVVNRARLKKETAARIATYRIESRSPYQPAGTLSGGNQQKLVLSRELSTQHRLLVVVHPTRGLDSEAARFVYERLRQSRDLGMAVVLISADLDEILLLSDRVGVLYGGSLFGLYDRARVSPGMLGRVMVGSNAEEEAAT